MKIDEGVCGKAVRVANWCWLLESGLALGLALLVGLVLYPCGMHEGVAVAGGIAVKAVLPSYALLSLGVLATAVRRGELRF